MNENEEYHNDITRISNSGLSLINKSPAKYEHRYLKGNKQKDTKALTFGSAFHSFILEPDKFNNEFVIMPKYSGTGKYKLIEAFKSDNSQKTIITTEDYVDIVGMSKSIKNHRIANELVTDAGFSEKRFDWTDSDTGAPCKIKPDRYNTTKDIIIDLKSTDDASEEQFKFSAKKYRYHIQAPFYFDGLVANGFKPDIMVFIAVEKTPPYLVNCFFYAKDEMEYGRQIYKDDLAVYMECKKNNKWPGYPEGIKLLQIPGFYVE